MIPFFLLPRMKVCHEEESYLLPDDLFCQPISYCTVSLTLFFFSSYSDRAHQSPYEWLLYSSVSFISSWRDFSISKSLTIRSAMPVSASMFGKVFWNPFHSTFSTPKSFVDSPPPPSDDLHPKDPLKVYAIPLGRPIADIPRMIYCLLRSMKSKLMVDEAFAMIFLLHLN